MGELAYANKIWKANKLYISGAGKDPCATRVPTMKAEGPGNMPTIADNEAKSCLFQKVFFIPPPDILPDMPDDYPDPAFIWPDITNEQIDRNI